MGKLRVLGVSSAVVAALLSSTTAFAQTSSEHAQAEALSDAATAAREAGQPEVECQRLEASARLEPSAGRLLRVGECSEQLGRTATAWATYGRAAVLARRDGSADEQARAESEATRLEPALAKLSIVVPAAHQLSGLEVFQDGVLVDPALYAVGVAVDPGPHRLVARAPGHASWSMEIGLPAAPGTVSVTVPLLGWSPVPALPALKAPAAAFSASGPSPERDEPGATQRTVGWVVGGVGATLLGAGTVAAMIAQGHERDLEASCSTQRICDAESRNDLEALRSSQQAAALLFVAGGLSLATGVVVHVLAPKERRSVTALGVAPVVAPGGAGFVATGRF